MGDHDVQTISTASFFGVVEKFFMPVRNRCCCRRSPRQSHFRGSIAQYRHLERDGCPVDGVKYLINKLRKAGRLKWEGNSRIGRWVIKKCFFRLLGE